MLRVCLLAAALSLLVAAGGGASAMLPPLNFTGFIWAENLAIMDDGSAMFVSDARAGTLSRVHLDTSVSPPAYKMTTHLTGFSAVLGLALDDASTETGYAAVGFTASKHGIISFGTNATAAGSYKVVAGDIGDLLHQCNGVALDRKRKLLYTSMEGYFIPGQGRLARVDVTTGQFTKMPISKLSGADGVVFDANRDLLYVSRVQTAELLVFNVSRGTAVAAPPLVRHYHLKSKTGVRVVSIDDMGLNRDGTTLYMADFRGDQVLAMDALTGANLRVIYTQVSNPTSVRFGHAPFFNSTSLYVTEGGSVIHKNHNQRVFRIPGVFS